VLVLNSVVSENYATGAGAAFDLRGESSLTVASSLIVQNQAEFAGAAATIRGGSEAEIFSSTIVGNKAPFSGAFQVSGEANIANSIVWRNITTRDSDDVSGDVAMVYTANDQGIGGRGNTGADPRLDGDFRLRVGSPCIDSGSETYHFDGARAEIDDDLGSIYAEDVAGNARITGESIDMGAHEW